MAQRRGLILDIDGTLIDSNDAHAEAFAEAFAAMGANVEFAAVRRLIGMGGDKLIPALRPGWNIDEGLGAAVDRRKKALFRERYLHELRPFPGSRTLVRRAIENGFEVAVASSAEKELLHHLLRIAEVDDLIEKRTGSGDVENSKPDPDVIRAALRRLDMAPADAVMVGDTPYDVEAAQRTQVASIAVRCGGVWDDASLRGARVICDGPADLAARWADVMGKVFSR